MSISGEFEATSPHLTCTPHLRTVCDRIMLDWIVIRSHTLVGRATFPTLMYITPSLLVSIAPRRYGHYTLVIRRPRMQERQKTPSLLC